MKVCIINNGILPVPPIDGGGVETWMYEVAKRLRRYQPVIFSIRPVNYREVETQIDNVTYKWVKLNQFDTCLRYILKRLKLFQHRPYVLKLNRKLKHEKCDIFHLQNNLFFAPFIKKICPHAKIIVHLQNKLLFEKTIFLHLHKDLTSYFKLVDHIITVSEYLKDDTLKYFSERIKFSTIYSGVDTERFKPLPPESVERIRKKYNIPPERKVILYVGRLVPDKGVHVLLKAMQETVKRHPEALLVVVGSHLFYRERRTTPYIFKLKMMSAKIRNNIIFTGYVPYLTEIHNIFAMSDICVVPSVWQEPLGLTNLEAQSCGRALIASRIGGIPEIVHDGETGILVKPNNQSSLTEAINTLLENEELRTALGRNAREHVLANFTWDHTAERCENLYDDLF